MSAVSGGDPRCVVLRSNWTNQYENWRKRLGLHCASPLGLHEPRKASRQCSAGAESPEGDGSNLYHLVPRLDFFWEIKKKNVIFILTCLKFSKVNGWLVLLYLNVTGVVTQWEEGRCCPTRKGSDLRQVVNRTLVLSLRDSEGPEDRGSFCVTVPCEISTA